MEIAYRSDAMRDLGNFLDSKEMLVSRFNEFKAGAAAFFETSITSTAQSLNPKFNDIGSHHSFYVTVVEEILRFDLRLKMKSDGDLTDMGLVNVTRVNEDLKVHTHSHRIGKFSFHPTGEVADLTLPGNCSLNLRDRDDAIAIFLHFLVASLRAD